MDLPPILTMACPFFRDVHHRQIQHFQQSVIGRKYGPGFCDFPQLTVESLDHVGRVDQAPDRLRLLEIGGQIRPVIFPRFRNLRIFSAPFPVKVLQFS